MGNLSTRPTATSPPESPVPPSSPRRSRTDSLTSTSSGESTSTISIFTPPPTPPTPPTPPRREECIRNLVAESRGCNQLEILVDTYGEPVHELDTSHRDVESLLEDINIRAKREFQSYFHGYRLKSFIKQVLIWDNRVAFTVKDPDTDAVVIFRMYHR